MFFESKIFLRSPLVTEGETMCMSTSGSPLMESEGCKGMEIIFETASIFMQRKKYILFFSDNN